MAKKDRDKQVWFVPKRANIHQMVALLHGIIQRSYDGTTWNAQKQDNLNLELKKLGATRDGGKIAPQGMRTLLASVHYLGFVYLDTTTTPTTLRLTKVGYDFYEAHKHELKKIPRLEKKLTINTSDHVLVQMNKLQITNPIVLPHCEDIYVFPFRVTIKMLLELGYLDKEEIALYVFHTTTMEQIDFKIQEIKNFRKLLPSDRETLVNAYKATEIGNITLKQAPTAGYFMQFCEGTGVINRGQVATNKSSKIDAISIKDVNRDWAEEMLQFFSNVDTYDFRKDLKLWISYFGMPDRLKPPVNLELNNVSGEAIYFEVNHKQDGLIDAGIFRDGASYNVPVFEDEEYTLSIFKTIKSEKLYDYNFVGEKNSPMNIKLSGINDKFITDAKPENATYGFDDIAKEILEHSTSKNFTDKMLQKLRLLNTRLGIDKTNDKSLRGAVYEQLFYDLLLDLKERGIIQDIFWNGKIGKYDLPVQAPGGKTGTPDMIFIQNGIHYVLELTTIKSKSLQFQAEISSVPDHIKLYEKVTSNSAKPRGIFCAPQIHDRNHVTMDAILEAEGIEFASVTDADFIKLLDVTSAPELSTNLNKLFS